MGMLSDHPELSLFGRGSVRAPGALLAWQLQAPALPPAPAAEAGAGWQAGSTAGT